MALNETMHEALRLTRSGNLLEATALLRAGLGSGGAATPGQFAEMRTTRTYQPQQLQLRAPGAAEQAPPAKSASAAKSPDRGSSFEERICRTGQSSMPYWLYLPARAAAKMPLVVMLHGCTQSSQDFARGTGMNRLADELGFIVAYPQQSQAANVQKCWNWFRPGDQQSDRGEPAQLAAITRQVIAEHAIDPAQVYIAGLSAGGAAAAIMAAQYPDLYAAVGIHSGLACGAARDLPSALAAMKRGSGLAPTTRQPLVPLITFHGDRDTTVSEVNSRQIVAAATAAATDEHEVLTEKVRGKSGRSYTRAQTIGINRKVLIEQWTIEGLGHSWSGGDASGTYTDPSGPDASRAMIEFFLEQRLLQ